MKAQGWRLLDMTEACLLVGIARSESLRSSRRGVRYALKHARLVIKCKGRRFDPCTTLYSPEKRKTNSKDTVCGWGARVCGASERDCFA